MRDKSKIGYDVALVTTDLAASAAQIIERYASRWSIEVAIEDAKQTGGVGQARNRVRLVVERTVPFALIVNTLAIVWYATVGYHPDDVDERRELAPWYRRRPNPRSSTCSPSSGALSSPAIYGRKTPSRPPAKKSPSCAWPGRTSRHN